MANTQRKPLQKGRLGFADDYKGDGDLVFQFNPREVEYDRAATYSRNQAAKADFPNRAAGSRPAYRWQRNEPEELTLELFLHSDGDTTIEVPLQKLDDFMRPSETTGEPRELIFVWGKGRSDRGRILRKRVRETLFNHDLECQEARVSLTIGLEQSRNARRG